MKYWLVLILMLVPLAMADYYNTTALENAQDPYNQALEINTITDGLLGFGMVIMAFAIPYVILSLNYGAVAGLGGASFFSLIIATMLLPLGFIPFWVYRITLVMAGIGVFLGVILKS